MTQTIAYLEAVIGADITNFRRGMREVRNEIGLLSDSVGGLAHLGRTLTFGLTVPLLAAGGAAVKTAADFDAAMRNINSITFLTEDQLSALSERVLEFGSSIRSGPQAAAEALYTVFSAGITDTEAAFTAMQIGAMTAEAGLANLTETTEGLVAAALTFGDQSEAAMMRYSDATTLAVQLGVGMMDTFNTGFANVMGSAAALGVTFEDMAATVSFLSQRGIDAAAAGTYLNNALSKLMKPGEELSGVFDELGVRSGRELIATFGGIEGALRAIYGVVGSNETAWAELFPDVRGFRAVSRLFTAFEEDGTDAVSEFFGNFEDKMAAGGLTMAAWEQQMMSFEAQWGMLTSAVQGFAIAVGSAVLPMLVPFIQGLRDLFLQLSNTNPEILQLGVVIAGVVAAAGPLLWLLGSLFSPLGIITGLVAAFALDVGGVRTALDGMIPPGIKEAVDDLTEGIGEFFRVFTDNGDITPPNFADFIPPDIPSATVRIQEFTIEPGDTPGQIAAELGVTVQEILDATGAADVYHLPIGNFQLEFTDDSASREALNVAFRMFEQAGLGAGEAMEAQDNSLGGRLSRAIDAAWPTISDALTRLKDEFLAWFGNTLLPAIGDWVSTIGAQGLGTAMGALAGELAQAIGAALSGTDGETRAALDRAMAVIPDELQYQLGQDVVRPNFFTTFGNNFVEGLKNGFLSALQDASFDNIGELVFSSVVGAVGAVLVVNRLITALTGLNIGGMLVSAISTVFKAAFAAQGAATVGTEVVTSVGASVQASAAGAAGTTAAGVIAAGLAGVILGAAVYFALPEEAKQLLQQKFWGWLDDAFGPGTIDQVQRGFEDLAYAAAAGIAEASGNTQLAEQFRGYISEQFADTNFGGLVEVPVEIDPSIAGTGFDDQPVTLPYTVDMSQPIADGLAEATTDPAVLAASDAVGPAIAPAITQGMIEAINSGETTPTAIADSLINPIRDAFILAFGTEGVVTLQWSAFVLLLGNDLITMGISFTNLKDVAIGAFGEMTGSVTNHLANIRSSIYSTVGAISSLISAIHGLQSAMGSLSQTNMSLPSVGGGPQPHASGGSISFGDTVLVGERGPEIFTASRSGSILPNSALRGGIHGGGGGNTTQIVNIYEAHDLDTILYEAKRRGISLA